ncbi:MAG: NAD-dependent DNA ligase LigA, partial [Spirochaetota bacterium]
DSRFDMLWDELRRLDPENALFVEVGRDESGGLSKREHVIPMGSQEKAADPQAFLKWAERVGHDRYIVQLKMDGASLELQYERGKFTHGVTRGDGVVGDDITANVRQMQGLVAELPDGFSGAVRGEVLLSRALHQERHSEKANPRNAANGIMKRKDGAGSSDLTIICYDAISSERDDFFEREQDKLAWLVRSGFMVVEYRVVENAEDVIAYREEVAARRDELPFEIDGLVVKGEEIDPDDARRARPERQIAFKFELEEAASTVKEVVFSASGSLYTPIAVVEPVRLAGTTVKRASLANVRLMRELGIMVGSRVAVSKRGEIIPKIERVLENPPNAVNVVMPTVCEVCGSALDEDGTRLFCPNEACEKRAFYRVRKWLDVLDVQDFGDVILAQLFEHGVVREIADLYALHIDDLVQFDRVGEKLALKLLSNLRAKTEVSLAKFVGGFNIEGVGELIVEKAVLSGYDTLDRLRNASADDLAQVNGIGQITGATIESGLRQLQPQMDRVLATGAVTIAKPISGALSGKSFCFTGTLATMTRAQAQEMVRQAGGQITSSVTKHLDYLVTNQPESGSSKNKKAHQLGVPTVSEEEFRAMIEADS